MLDALAVVMPDFVRQLSEALKAASPLFLIIIGGLLFFFAGAVKWIAKLVGAGMVIYGLLVLLGYL